MANRAYVYRIYPTDKQIEQLQKTFGCCRFVYNQMLTVQQERYDNGEKHLSKILDRYGHEFGSYLTDRSTPYKKVSLPAKEDTVQFHRYKVAKPLCLLKGTTAPGFGQSGMGTQYFLVDENSARMIREKGIEFIYSAGFKKGFINFLIDKKILERVPRKERHKENETIR